MSEEIMSASIEIGTAKTLLKQLPAMALCAVMAIGAVSAARAQQVFKSPEEATDQLVAAVRADDNRAVLKILGPDGRDILFSGDKVADDKTRALFLTTYDVRHQVAKTGNDKAELLVGRDDWPLPIPLVAKDGNWTFDTNAGRKEILYRRIGRNELAAIQVMLSYVDAQQDYAAMNPEKDGGYAQRFISAKGKKDGLYWPTDASQPPSPLGPAFALATATGYRLTGEQTPFHGYYYKILTAQGPGAPGGAVDYVVNGKMIGGFALVAYPAEYGNSGVMTFLVNHKGVIYQKDLGDRTTSIASRMTTFNPDQTWKKVPDGDLVVSR